MINCDNATQAWNHENKRTYQKKLSIRLFRGSFGTTKHWTRLFKVTKMLHLTFMNCSDMVTAMAMPILWIWVYTIVTLPDVTQLYATGHCGSNLSTDCAHLSLEAAMSLIMCNTYSYTSIIPICFHIKYVGKSICHSSWADFLQQWQYQFPVLSCCNFLVSP